MLKFNNATVLAQKVGTASDPEPVLFTLYPVLFTALIYEEIGRKYQGCTNFEKCRSYHKFQGARPVTCSKFHTKDPQIIGVTVQNLVTMANWCLGFVHPCVRIHDLSSKCATVKPVRTILQEEK